MDARFASVQNECVAMGNWLASVDDPPGEAVAVLRDALEDESELVREHAVWALGGAPVSRGSADEADLPQPSRTERFRRE